MRVLTWNMNKASSSPWAKSSAKKWKSFLEMSPSPDIAMFQEVNGVPDAVSERYHVEYVKASWLGGGKAKFGTAVLARKSDWTMGSEVPWKSEHDWVNRIQERFPGWLVGRQVENGSGDRYMAVSVYSPAWPVWRCSKVRGGGKSASCKLPAICEILDGVDVTPVKLEAPDQRYLWFTEILWSLLKGATAGDGGASKWIVAGDFNSSVLFDESKNTGNGEIIARFKALGLLDCVFKHHGEHGPTYWAFRERKRQPPVHQLDYVYVSAPVLDRLRDVALGGGLPEEDKWRSDHLPVVCDFR